MSEGQEPSQNSDRESPETDDQESNVQESNVTLEELRKLRRENQGLRKRLHEQEALDQQRKEAEMTEVEKLKKQLGDYQQKEMAWANEKRAWAVQQAVQSEASRLGIIDPDAAYRLIEVEEIEEVGPALQELVKAKPYLKGAGMTSISPTNPANPARQPQMFTRSQLRDVKFFAEHRDEIMQAMKDGRILDE